MWIVSVFWWGVCVLDESTSCRLFCSYFTTTEVLMPLAWGWGSYSANKQVIIFWDLIPMFLTPLKEYFPFFVLNSSVGVTYKSLICKFIDAIKCNI